jgi:hypothetical protein
VTFWWGIFKNFLYNKCSSTAKNRAKARLFPESNQLCTVKFRTTGDEIYTGRFYYMDYVLEETYAFIFIGKDSSNDVDVYAQVLPFYRDPVEIIVKATSEDDQDAPWEFYEE